MHQSKKNKFFPSIILSKPQLGENVGMVARAMLNFGFDDLRLISPREDWLNEKTYSASAGADLVLDNSTVHKSIAEATEDLQYVYATTIRVRDMHIKYINPQDFVKEAIQTCSKKNLCGLLFGGEASGLSNDDLVFSKKTILIPTNPNFPSLNLSQSVGILAYEFSKSFYNLEIKKNNAKSPNLAKNGMVEGFYGQLEQELEKGHFFKTPDIKPTMIRNIRNIFQRANLTDQEVHTLRGIISALIRNK